jgi:hypothetical protein
MRDYCKLAEECLKAALKIKDRRHRRAFLELASDWLELAERDLKTDGLIAEVEALKRPAH